MQNGAIIQTWTGFSTPIGISCDQNNNVYVGNSVTETISIITSSGILTT